MGDFDYVAHNKILEKRVSEYLDLLPDWIPKRILNEVKFVLDDLAWYLDCKEIRSSIESFNNPPEEYPIPSIIEQSEDISDRHFINLIGLLAEVDHAISLGKNDGLLFLDKEDRTARALSQSGQKGASVKSNRNAKVVEYALKEAEQVRLKNPSISPDEIAVEISNRVFEYSRTQGGKTLRSRIRAPRTIKDWLSKDKNNDKI